MRCQSLACFVAAILCGNFVTTLHGAGYRLANQDAEAIARGNAFVATADNPSAIYYNPAGITQLEGHDFSLGLYLISVDAEYEGPMGGTASTDASLQPLPQLHYVYSPQDNPFSFGFGIYAPYGLGVDYGTDTPFSTLGVETELLYGSFNPVVAVELAEGFSLAAGLTLNYSSAVFERRIGLVPGDRFEFDGEDFAVGFNLGMLWKISEHWSVGANFRSPTKMDYDGDSQASPFSKSVPTSANLTFPAFVDFGVSFRPTEKWNIEANIDWTDWDSVNETIFSGTFGGDQVLKFNYESSFMYELGVTRYFDNGWQVSLGYIYSENSVPDQNFSPLNPDADLHLGSIGVGYERENFGVHFGYHFAYNGGRDVTGSESTSLIGETADGRYKIFNHAVNLTFRFRF